MPQQVLHLARQLWPTPEAVFALLTRATQGLTALLAAVIVAQGFSLEQQGLFFVFLSFGALVQLSDLGLTYAVLQTAGPVAATGDPGQLAGFLCQARRLGACVMFVAAVWVGSVGGLVLAGHTATVWLGPWLAFIGATAVAQYMQVELALVEGARSAAQAWRLRLLQEGLGGAAFIVALLSGATLWSLGLYWGARASVAALWLAREGTWSARTHPAEPTSFPWLRQVWPFQWRMGLSGLSGFLIFQAFNPILLVEQGSSVAARFGMSLALMNMLLLITTAWPLSQAARYGQLLAQRSQGELLRRFRRMRLGSSALAGLMALCLLGAMHWAGQQQLPLAERWADMSTSAALLGAALAHHLTACYAVLLRAERREPLLRLSVIGGMLGVLAIWLAARHGHAQEVALTHLGFALIGLLIVLKKYQHFKSRQDQA